MSGEILDTDFQTGIQTIFHRDVHAGEQNIIETRQDCEDIIEANKASYNQFDERTGWKGDGFHRVANIPNVILFDLKKRGILDDTKSFLRWLDAPENRAFRTRPGSLSR